MRTLLIGERLMPVNTIVNAPRLRAIGATVADVVDAFNTYNGLPLGLVKSGNNQMFIRR